MPSHPFPPPISPMEARTRESIPVEGFAYEPKWDGFRALAWSADGAEPRLDSRRERPLLRYFPELRGALLELPNGTVVDGEIVVVRDGRLDFDQLSNRIHPAASRVDMLAEETPAELVAFDLLAVDGDDLRGTPFTERRQALVELVGELARWHLTPSTTDATEGERWFHEFEAAGCDGIVCKPLDGPYVEGKREMLKVKHRRSADVVVAGFRIHKHGPEVGVGSLLLGLHDETGRLHFVGHCSNFSDEERRGLYVRLEELRTDDDPFGEDARRPGAPSRWSGGKDSSWVALEPELVCEVTYEQVTGIRFRHATRFERWRPDKDPEECTLEQIARPGGAAFADVVATATNR